MTATKTVLQGAPVVDFTGTIKCAHSLPAYGPEFVALVRGKDKPAAIVIIDRAVEMPVSGPVVIRDHLNLTGTSPLLGPNHECGERFPVVQGIYIDDLLPELPRVLAGGLKEGVKLDEQESQLLRDFSVEACCYNAVPAMLIAAHARCRILAILVPSGQELPDSLLKQITELTGAK